MGIFRRKRPSDNPGAAAEIVEVQEGETAGVQTDGHVNHGRIRTLLRSGIFWTIVAAAAVVIAIVLIFKNYEQVGSGFVWLGRQFLEWNSTWFQNYRKELLATYIYAAASIIASLWFSRAGHTKSWVFITALELSLWPVVWWVFIDFRNWNVGEHSLVWFVCIEVVVVTIATIAFWLREFGEYLRREGWAPGGIPIFRKRH